jgi:hypothetical protein
MTRWRWALLIFELLLIALILVLPQADLPDYTFHSGTAPIAAKARLSSASMGAGMTMIEMQMALPSHLLEDRNDTPGVTASPGSDVLLALLCSFLC